MQEGWEKRRVILVSIDRLKPPERSTFRRAGSPSPPLPLSVSLSRSPCPLVPVGAGEGGRFRDRSHPARRSAAKPVVDQRENISSMAVKLGERNTGRTHAARRVGRQNLQIERAAASRRAINRSPPKAETAKADHSSTLAADVRRRTAARNRSPGGGGRQETPISLTALESQLMERRISRARCRPWVPINAERKPPFAGTRPRRRARRTRASTSARSLERRCSPRLRWCRRWRELPPGLWLAVELNHGNEFSSRYAHLRKLKVKPSGSSASGQMIALGVATPPFHRPASKTF